MHKLHKEHVTDAVAILDHRYFAGRQHMQSLLDEERANADIARMVFELRQKAGLTQRELAARVGTTASVISRLEDADYRGHSLAMLRRIGAALGKRVRIDFVPARPRRASA